MNDHTFSCGNQQRQEFGMYCLCILWGRFFLCTYLFLFTIQSFALYLERQVIYTYLCDVLLWCKIPAVWTASKSILGAGIYFEDLIKTSFTSLVFCIQGIMSWSSCLSISLSTCLNQMSVNVHVDLESKKRHFLGQNLQVLIGCCISRLE